MQGGAELQMVTREEIMKELAAGHSIEEIADAITNTINEANTAYKLQQEEEAKRAEEARVAQEAIAAEELRVCAAKTEAVNMMIDGLCDYLVAVGRDDLLEECHSISTDEVVKAVDGMIEMLAALEGLKMLEYGKKPRETESAESPSTASYNEDNGIDAIFKVMGLF